MLGGIRLFLETEDNGHFVWKNVVSIISFLGLDSIGGCILSYYLVLFEQTKILQLLWLSTAINIKYY